MTGSPRIGPLKVKAQLLCGDEPAMGPGKADLLDAIAQHGSISAAGRALGMSYRRTWLLVDSMNRHWAEPLVEATSGGGQARGAQVTACGRRVLKAYRALEARIEQAVVGPALDDLSDLLLGEPRASQKDPVNTALP
jgi:molybdate transport system regulatory protein